MCGAASYHGRREVPILTIFLAPHEAPCRQHSKDDLLGCKDVVLAAMRFNVKGSFTCRTCMLVPNVDTHTGFLDVIINLHLK